MFIEEYDGFELRKNSFDATDRSGDFNNQQTAWCMIHGRGMMFAAREEDPLFCAGVGADEEHTRAQEDVQHASDVVSDTGLVWSDELWFNLNASTDFVLAQRSVEIAERDLSDAATSDEFATALCSLADVESKLATAESLLIDADARVEETYETHQQAIQEKDEALARLQAIAS